MPPWANFIAGQLSLQTIPYKSYRLCALQVLQTVYPTSPTDCIPYKSYRLCTLQVLQTLYPTSPTDSMPYKSYRFYTLQVLRGRPQTEALPRVYRHAKRSPAHVKRPVVRVRVQWIMETPKHPACTVGWVAGFPRGKRAEFSMGEIPM